MTRYHVYEIYHKDGTVERNELPWGVNDYLQAIADLEAEITPRRIREAFLSSDGAGWMGAKEAEIAALRRELAGLGGE